MKYKKIHFVGIKGVGMTPLAIIAKEAGFDVTGSDVEDEFITENALSEARIKPLIGFSKDHLINIDLVITTGAHGGYENIEVRKARKNNIKVISQGEAVGIFMSGEIFGRKLRGISVAGTHGKTTTTAMIATVLKKNWLDPSFVIGTGDIPSLGSPGHFGKGEFFVAEADEYATEPVFDKTPKFLWQHPEIAVITNIDYDHPDIYKSIDEVTAAFSNFAKNLSNDSLLVTCGDDEQVQKMLANYQGRKITYGFDKKNDIVINNFKFDNGTINFSLTREKDNLGKFSLSLLGQHNALNATGSIIVGLELGLSLPSIRKALLEFKGTKRRSEYVGELITGAKIFDDYAHHPTEIKSTLKGFRESFPNHKIICIFQPHTYSRTKLLFDQFVDSFNDVDLVIMTEIYASLREKPIAEMSSENLIKSMDKSKIEAVFLPKLSDVIEYVSRNAYKEDTIIITMGAGDVYKINEKLKMKS